jgi:hypothetical protein
MFLHHSTDCYANGAAASPPVTVSFPNNVQPRPFGSSPALVERSVLSQTESGSSFTSTCPRIISASEHSYQSKRSRSDDYSECSGYSWSDGSTEACKRSRPNEYLAPRTIKNTFLSTMGSLVAHQQQRATQNTATPHHQQHHRPGTAAATTTFERHVPLRRQLSGGKLEPYLGNHDAMEVESSDSRPRRMSL